MKLLLTNDDGINAQGIFELARELSKEHDVTLVAPERERSGNSQLITIKKPLTVEQVTVEGLDCDCYSCSGSPADCTKVGILYLKGFDAVISGINHGSNIGTDVFYSGTLGAAREAVFTGVPSMAVSLTPKNLEFMPTAAKIASDVIRTGIISELKPYTFLNLNVPALPLEEVKGVKWVRQGFIDYGEHYDAEEDGLLLKGPMPRIGLDVGYDTEFEVLKAGYAAMTPMKCDTTDGEALKELSRQYKFREFGEQ